MKMNRRQFLLTGVGAIFGSAIGIGSYTRLIEPHWVEYTRVAMDVDNLPDILKGKKLVHISDLHAGPYVNNDYLLKVFRGINTIKPDIVVITGDFITYRSQDQIYKLRKMIPEFPKGQIATIAILGNHDYGPGWSDYKIAEQVQMELESGDVTVLRNEMKDIGGLNFIGMDDLWAGNFKPDLAFQAWDNSNANIALCHNPDALDRPGWKNYKGWVLSGHTHGGQCKPPFMAPPLLPIENKRYASGEINLLDGQRLYVNRGIGHLIPVRFNVRPEVTIFTLEKTIGEAA
jgi:predicted MPP superfamily phosphohydrolase